MILTHFGKDLEVKVWTVSTDRQPVSHRFQLRAFTSACATVSSFSTELPDTPMALRNTTKKLFELLTLAEKLVFQAYSALLSWHDLTAEAAAAVSMDRQKSALNKPEIHRFSTQIANPMNSF